MHHTSPVNLHPLLSRSQLRANLLVQLPLNHESEYLAFTWSKCSNPSLDLHFFVALTACGPVTLDGSGNRIKEHLVVEWFLEKIDGTCPYEKLHPADELHHLKG